MQQPLKKTIWYINKYASPPGANGGLRGLSLAKEFKKLGHEAIVVNSRSNHYIVKPETGGEPIGGGFTISHHWGVSTFTHRSITYIKTSSLRRILSWLHFEWGLLRLPTQKLPEPTHIIVSSLSLLTILNGYRLARKFKSRLIFEIRDIWPLSLTIESSYSLTNPLVMVLSWIEKFGYEKADVVVGTMPNLKEHVHRVAGQTVRVESIGLGLDPDLTESLKAKPSNRKHPGIVFTYSGSIGRANALPIILDVFAELDPHTNIEFHLYGKGDYLQDLKQRYETSRNIFFHGEVARSQLMQMLQDSDALILSAENSEIWRYGQSLHKVVEYMASARPIIAVYSGFPSMIDEAECGVFVDPSNQQEIVRAITNMANLSAKKRQEIGDRGRQWIVKHRTYRKLAMQYLTVMDT